MPLQKLRGDSFFSSSALIFLSKSLTSMAGLAVVLWYSKVLPVEEYGRYNNFWIQTNIFFPIACFGVHVWLITYSGNVLSKILRKLRVTHYMLYAAWLLLICSAFAMLQAYLGSIGFLLSLVFVTSYALSIMAESFLIVSRSYITLFTANLVYSMAYWLAHWQVFHTGFSLQAIFLYLAGVNICKLVICLPSIISYLSATKQQAITDEEMDVSKIRGLWLHMGAYDVVQNISGWIDKFIVSLVLSATASAIYFNGSMNIPFLPILVSAAGSAVLLQLADEEGTDERTRSIMLMNKSGRVLSCVVFPVFFFLLFFNAELIHNLLPKYAASIPVFVISLFVLPIRAYSFTAVFQRYHKGNIINTGAIGEIIVALLIMYPLYQWLGLPGVALSFVISCYLQVAYYMYHYTRLLNADPQDLMPFRNWLQKIIVFGFLFIGIHYCASLFLTEKIVLFFGWRGNGSSDSDIVGDGIEDCKKNSIMSIAGNNRIKQKDIGNTGFAANSNAEGGRIVNADGSNNLKKTGIPFYERISIYHSLLRMSRVNFFMAIFAFYTAINVVFALIYFAIGVNHLSGIDVSHPLAVRLLEAFFFSSQTLTTVGYGHIAPSGLLTNFVASTESLFGIIAFAVVTGLIYGRFSRPRGIPGLQS